MPRKAFTVTLKVVSGLEPSGLVEYLRYLQAWYNTVIIASLPGFSAFFGMRKKAGKSGNEATLVPQSNISILKTFIRCTVLTLYNQPVSQVFCLYNFQCYTA